MLRRVGLFILTNLIVMVVGSIVISLIMSIFGIQTPGVGYQDGSTVGQMFSTGELQVMAIYCGVWGMLGSFISLWMSKWMAKRFYGVQIVEGGQHSELVSRIHEYAKKAGLTTMPEVGIYQSNDINAFATGPSRNNSLVAVSSGLLNRMNDDQVEGVLAHEVAHIANGDMVTMTLVQGVVNAFVMFLAHVFARIIDNFFRDDNGRGGLGYFGYYLVRSLLHVAFGILTAPIVMGFSRYREFRADAGGAALAGKEKMIAALEGLKQAYPQLAEAEQPKGSENFQTMQISSKRGMSALFSTHPTLDDRINALRSS
jgi:heat shock protein HtpX